MTNRLLLPIMSSFGLFALGCGDDGGMTTPGVDASGPMPDACGTHSTPECMGADFEWLNHNGGEIRLEVVATPTGKMQIITYAFFLSAQTPEKLEYLTYGTQQNGAFGPCSETTTYNSSVNPGQAINDSRVYEDVGNQIFLRYGNQEIVLQKYENIADKRGLVMDIGYMVDGAPQGTVPPEMVLPGTEFEIEVPKWGVLPYKLKVPTNWQTVGGNVNMAGNTTNNWTTSINWEYAWNKPLEPMVDATLIQISGNNTAGMPTTWFCVGPGSETTIGRMDIQNEYVSKFPKSGRIQAASIAHQKVEWQGRLLDIIGVNCRQSSFTIQ